MQSLNDWPTKACDLALLSRAFFDTKTQFPLKYSDINVNLNAKNGVNVQMTFQPWVESFIIIFSQHYQAEGLSALTAFSHVLTELRLRQRRTQQAESPTWNLMECVLTSWMTHCLQGLNEPYRHTLSLEEIEQHSPDFYATLMRDVRKYQGLMKKLPVTMKRPMSQYC